MTQIQLFKLESRAPVLSEKERFWMAAIAEVIVKHPELLKPEFRKQVENGAHPYTGHCYVASAALFYFLSKDTKAYSPMVLNHEGVNHWVIVRNCDGCILDITKDQFKTQPDYRAGIKKGFVPKRDLRRSIHEQLKFNFVATESYQNSSCATEYDSLDHRAAKLVELVELHIQIEDLPW